MCREAPTPKIPKPQLMPNEFQKNCTGYDEPKIDVGDVVPYYKSSKPGVWRVCGHCYDPVHS